MATGVYGIATCKDLAKTRTRKQKSVIPSEARNLFSPAIEDEERFPRRFAPRNDASIEWLDRAMTTI
jgi:hypothetical protein